VITGAAGTAFADSTPTKDAVRVRAKVRRVRIALDAGLTPKEILDLFIKPSQMAHDWVNIRREV
jgi:hypothetical protein